MATVAFLTDDRFPLAYYLKLVFGVRISILHPEAK